MSGVVPSSALGSSAPGTPGAPIRSSRRTTCVDSGVFWPRAGDSAIGVAAKNVTRNVTSGARTAATRPNIGAGIIVFIRGTHYSRHSFREREKTRRSGTELAPFSSTGREYGDGVAREPHRWGKTQKIQHVNRRSVT